MNRSEERGRFRSAQLRIANMRSEVVESFAAEEGDVLDSQRPWAIEVPFSLTSERCASSLR